MTASNNGSKIFRYQLLAASILLFIMITVGGIMRASGVDPGCVDWPVCSGSLFPSVNDKIGIDYIHQTLAIITGLVLLTIFVKTWISYRHKSVVTSLISSATALYGVQVVLGAVFSQDVPPGVRTALHFGLSMVVLALILGSTVLSYYPSRKRLHIDDSFRSDPFARLSLITGVAIFLTLISGTVVVSTGASGACPSWPLCQTSLFSNPQNPAQWIEMIHRILTFFASISIVSMFYRAWKTQHQRADVLVSATTLGVLFLAQTLMGAVESEAGFPAYLKVLHEASAIAIWVASNVLILVVLMGHVPVINILKEKTNSLRKRSIKDFFALTKPIVVLLLLVTTYAGMVIAGRSWPSLGVTFWVLLGGFMAAGGSSAINQYIDHKDDVKMQRTQKRPIPSGRLSPAEGLAFGVGLSLASFYVMVAFVNLLAALLTLAGIIYYVLIYSIFLKKTTVQNIVIGGGAGAIPPLVGWAAVTGSLNIPALFLFAVVFLWTPPHFWALAIVRRKDYARAGVPMLPVVRGQAETRKQIFVYTVELVALTLLLPLFGLGESIYLVAAIVLGAGLLGSAWRVWKQEGNQVAWKMYRHSSMYLAFIFFALMVDALV
ncbi:MAG: heme o synthase [Anaerolineales bacterium]